MFIVKIMAIVTLATVIYVLLYAMQLKHIGYLIILLAGLTITGILVETVAPIVERVETKVQKVEETIDRAKKITDKLKLPGEERSVH